MKKVVLKNTWAQFIPHGWGNGYVIIPVGHPLHGKHYDELNEWIDVHYGLTFSEKVDQQIIENFGLDQEYIDAWAVGFDTAHYNDDLLKWPKEAVEAETEKLYQQLVNYK